MTHRSTPGRLAIIGCSLGGLLAALRFAERGWEVRLIEPDDALRLALWEGRLFEPALSLALHALWRYGCLSLSGQLNAGLEDCDVVFWWPDGPAIAGLARLERAIESIAPSLPARALFVVKAGVPLGAGAIVKDLLAREGRQDVRLAMSPEPPCRSTAVGETPADERVVVGVDQGHDALPLLELYGPIGRPVLVTSIDSAERLYQVSLSFWRTETAFAEAIADLCARAEAGLQDVRLEQPVG
ncbi:MAG TPA: hypothetical protein V6D47_12885 [Oscillatoriaceae cyanobacterium]